MKIGDILREFGMEVLWKRLMRNAKRTARRRLQRQWNPLASVGALEQRLLLAADFGDAPAPYPVLQADNGAEHEESNFRLGVGLTTEADGQPSANADADAGDDGVWFGSVLLYPGARRVEANVSLVGPGQTVYVDAWIDFNIDGDWDDAGEHVVDSDQTSVGGPEKYQFDVPADAAVGTTFVRVRVSKDPNLSVDGQTAGGEVEDYAVQIHFPPPRPDGLVGEFLEISGTQRPTITWPAVPGAGEYELYFQRESTGTFQTGNRIERYTVSGTEFTLPFDLPIRGGTSFWTRSFDSNGPPSVWSPRFRILIEGIAPSFSPLELNQPTGRPTLEWNHVEGAVRYDLIISSLSTNSLVIRETVEHTSRSPVQFTPEDELPLGRYRAWVQAGDAGSFTGDYSQFVDFRVKTAPQATNVTAATFDRTPELTWTEVKGTATYDVRVTSLNTGQVVHDVTGLTDTSWTPPTDLTDGSYRWQVVATGEQGTRSFWSDPVVFYAGGRGLVLSPAGDVLRRRQTFTWTRVDGAATYDLVVVDSFGTTQLDESGLTETSFHAVLGLFDYGSSVPMRAWVRAVSTTGEVGVWSAAREFTVIYE